MDETHQEVVHVFFESVLFLSRYHVCTFHLFFFPGEFASQKPPRATQLTLTNIRPTRCESTDDVAEMPHPRTTSATQTSPTDLVDWNQLPPVPQRSSSKVSDSGVALKREVWVSWRGGGVEEGWWILLLCVFIFFFWGGEGVWEFEKKHVKLGWVRLGWDWLFFETGRFQSIRWIWFQSTLLETGTTRDRSCEWWNREPRDGGFEKRFGEKYQ